MATLTAAATGWSEVLPSAPGDRCDDHRPTHQRQRAGADRRPRPATAIKREDVCRAVRVEAVQRGAEEPHPQQAADEHPHVGHPQAQRHQPQGQRDRGHHPDGRPRFGALPARQADQGPDGDETGGDPAGNDHGPPEVGGPGAGAGRWRWCRHGVLVWWSRGVGRGWLNGRAWPARGWPGLHCCRQRGPTPARRARRSPRAARRPWPAPSSRRRQSTRQHR